MMTIIKLINTGVSLVAQVWRPAPCWLGADSERRHLRQANNNTYLPYSTLL